MELARFYPKKLGETPLECLNRFKAENPEYGGLSATYAGRLDPAAEGEMLFLFGDFVHKKDEYLAHNKTYTATFAFGVSTDTGDLLGLPTAVASLNIQTIDEEKIKKVLSIIKKLTNQMYPAYSSKTVEGKPLFVHAREGSSIARPTRPVEIFQAELIDLKTVPVTELIDRVETVCNLVTGDFRQQEILQAWKEKQKSLQSEVVLATISFYVSSGTYIRGFPEIFQQILNLPTVLFSLRRDSIENKKSNVQ